MITTDRDFDAQEFEVVPTAILDELQLPAQTRKFLETIGLPKKDSAIADDVDGFLYLRFELPSIENRTVIVEDVRYFIVGYDTNSPKNYKICVEENEETLFTVNVKEKTLDRFINSNISLFFQCFEVYLETINFLKSKGDDASNELIVESLKQLRAKLTEIDANVTNEDGFWSNILEDLELEID